MLNNIERLYEACPNDWDKFFLGVISTIIIGVIAFLVRNAMQCSKTKREEFNSTIDDAVELTNITTTAACEYWMKPNVPNSEEEALLAHKIKSNITRISSKINELHKINRRFKKTAALDLLKILFTITTSGGFESEGRAKEPERLRYIGNRGLNLETFLSDSKVPKNWFN